MSDKIKQFPLYRKLSDDKSLYKILGDRSFIELQKKNIEGNKMGMKQYFGEAQKKQLLNNTMSAPFDYLNFKGGNTKLSDFKGKYVYIDVWATWCGPCRAEIPFLKKTEEKIAQQPL